MIATLLSSALISIVMLVFFSLLGMTLISYCFPKAEDQTGRLYYFMIAPIVGSAVWLSLCICLGMFLPYNRIFIICMLALAVCFIAVSRKRLSFVKDRNMWIFIAVSFLISIFLMYCVIPREINGGLYFTPSAFDHARVALIRSIAVKGLPPINPYLADNGKLITSVYHFGWQALAAQPTILCGCSALSSGAAGISTTFILSMLGMGAVLIKATGKSGSLLFLFIVSITGYAMPVLSAVLPASWQNAIFPEEYVGFWSLINDSVWTPHNIYAGIMVVIFISTYVEFLQCSDRKQSLRYGIVLGALAASAFCTSIYAGLFGTVIFVVTIIPFYLIDKEFRKCFNTNFIPQLLMLAAVFILCGRFLFYLLSQGNGASPVVFGILPAYADKNGLGGILGSILNLYFVVLPANIGPSYLLGILAVLIPGVLSKEPFARIGRIYVLLVYLSVFIIHSSVFTNDYGWRTTTASRNMLYIFAALLLYKLYEWIKPRKKLFAVGFAALIVLMPVVFSRDLIEQYTVPDLGTSVHQEFARAAKGWEAVREHTGTDDLVLCNPEGYKDLYDAAGSSNTNYLFSYYADRFTPIADATYTITSFSGPYSEEEILALHADVVDFFAGNPGRDKVAFIADRLNTEALLVTPRDGLWTSPGELGCRYKAVVTTDDYRVYIRLPAQNR